MPAPTATLPAADAVEELLHLLGDEPAAGPQRSRQRLRARLTVAPPATLPAEAWPLLDAVWAAEAQQRAPTRASELPRLAATGWGARVSHWRGDLTTLAVDAIVNAANSGLTGCYRPDHPCVDNAIHTAAGPRLREECGEIMARRGRPEPTSTATTTGGAFLPARFVIHTVGPIVAGRRPSDEDARALSRCYAACLAAAGDAGATSVAFCGISTGVFGYPVAAAAPVAIAAVREGLAKDPRLEHVVLVTFSAADQAATASAFLEALRA